VLRVLFHALTLTDGWQERDPAVEKATLLIPSSCLSEKVRRTGKETSWPGFTWKKRP